MFALKPAPHPHPLPVQRGKGVELRTPSGFLILILILILIPEWPKGLRLRLRSRLRAPVQALVTMLHSICPWPLAPAVAALLLLLPGCATTDPKPAVALTGDILVDGPNAIAH